MDEVLHMITTNIPHLVPLTRTLSLNVYQPIMAGECPRLRVDRLMAQYPGFFSSVQDQMHGDPPCYDSSEEKPCGSPLNEHHIPASSIPDVNSKPDFRADQSVLTKLKANSMEQALMNGEAPQLPTPQCSKSVTPDFNAIP